MAENDVFSETKTEESASPLDALVGEGKKFKTVEDLAKGKQEADSFIEQLKQEKHEVEERLKALEKDSNTEATAKELLEELRASKKKDGSEGTSLSETDLEQKVKQILQGESAAQTAKQNREQGNKLVLDKFKGDVDAAKAFLAERANELGTTPQKLAELSETSPKLFAKAIDANLSTPDTSVSALHGVNTSAMGATDMAIDGVPTKAHFDKLKKDMGVQQFLNNKSIQRQYLDAAMKLGERFYN